jgi:hypothetical protein
VGVGVTARPANDFTGERAAPGAPPTSPPPPPRFGGDLPPSAADPDVVFLGPTPAAREQAIADTPRGAATPGGGVQGLQRLDGISLVDASTMPRSIPTDRRSQLPREIRDELRETAGS